MPLPLLQTAIMMALIPLVASEDYNVELCNLKTEAAPSIKSKNQMMTNSESKEQRQRKR